MKCKIIITIDNLMTCLHRTNRYCSSHIKYIIQCSSHNYTLYKNNILVFNICRIIIVSLDKQLFTFFSQMMLTKLKVRMNNNAHVRLNLNIIYKVYCQKSFNGSKITCMKGIKIFIKTRIYCVQKKNWT
jgi:hypothetical protein